MSLVILLSTIALLISTRLVSHTGARRGLILVLLVGFLLPVLGLKPAYAAPIAGLGASVAVDGDSPASFIAPHALRHDSSVILAFVHHKFHFSLRSRSQTRLSALDTAPDVRNASSLAAAQRGKRLILGRWLSAAVNPVKVSPVLLC